jgi:hypothetical protein
MSKYQPVPDNIHCSLTPAEVAAQFKIEANTRCELFCEQLKSLLENNTSLLYGDLIKAASSGESKFSINYYHQYNKYIPRIEKQKEVTSCFRQRVKTVKIIDPAYVTVDELDKYHPYLVKSLELHFPSIKESTYKIRVERHYMTIEF